MKLVTFSTTAGAARLGALTADGTCVVDLHAAHRLLAGREEAELTSMQALIEGGARALDFARRAAANAPERAVTACGDVRLHAPLPRPAQIRDFLSFETHLKQSFRNAMRVRAADAPDPAAALVELEASGRFDIPQVWYRQPIYYKANRFAVSGPDEDIHWPAYSRVMDYELELAAVIGTGGRDIPRERALHHVFGYTIFNDFSARDAQMIEMEGMLGPAKGKDFDGANAFGPCITTADELGDPCDLTMIARVNGEQWSRGHSGEMYHRFEDMIAHASRGETLHPGEILGSGTVGNGCGVELMRFLGSGDVVELEIDRIGVLRNRVIAAGRQ